jgi:5-methylcytosine-specific restriction endonuclease McrA
MEATSVTVEHVFSHRRRLLHFTCNHMSATSFRYLLCLGSWGRRDLLRINNLIAACSSKKRKHIQAQDKADSSENEIVEIVE